jgi:hypothetical protein
MKSFLKIQLTLVDEVEDKGVCSERVVSQASERIPVGALFARVPLQQIMTVVANVARRFA